jgi:hypothetical protein
MAGCFVMEHPDFFSGLMEIYFPEAVLIRNLLALI